MDRECLHRFMFEELPDARSSGAAGCRLARAASSTATTPRRSATLLGEAVGRVLLLAATSSSTACCRCSCRATGPCSCWWRSAPASFGVRGVARTAKRGSRGRRHRAADRPGRLTVTLETDERPQRYQGIVPHQRPSVWPSPADYFENSEQLPTRLWLHADADGASGMLLQRLPGERGAPARTGTRPATMPGAGCS